MARTEDASLPEVTKRLPELRRGGARTLSRCGQKSIEVWKVCSASKSAGAMRGWDLGGSDGPRDDAWISG
jgi:hypothetical protein